MQINTFSFDLIDSKMYVFFEKDEAILIDPCVSEDALLFLRMNRVVKIKIILTHEHYDHISGVEWFRSKFNSCEVICSKACDENMKSATRNGSKFFKALFLDKAPELLEAASNIVPMTCYGDIIFEFEKLLFWNGHEIFMKTCPGHSKGSICIVVDNDFLFTGDSLLKADPVITKLPGGNQKEYESITLPFLKSLDSQLYVYPGHGESGFLYEFVL